MKFVRDFSVTSAIQAGAGLAWNAPWAAPISGTAPGLVLDFAASRFGAGSQALPMASVLNMTRASAGGYFDSAGALQQAGANVARIDHDPATLANEGLLSEAARTNLILGSAAPADQTVAVTAVPMVLSFFGTGAVTLAGAHVATLSGAGAFPARAVLAFTPSAGDLNLTFTGEVLHAQLETGGHASTPIETTGASATRAADEPTVTLGTWFDTTGGTLAFGGTLANLVANDRIIELDAGDSSTRISVLWNATLGLPQLQVWDGGTLQAAIAPSGSAIAMDEPFRVAIGFAANDFAISLNGSAVVTDTAGTLPAGLSTLRIGRSVAAAQGFLHCESAVYYPGRLSDADIAALAA